jgi:hypothetical protein
VAELVGRAAAKAGQFWVAFLKISPAPQTLL